MSEPSLGVIAKLRVWKLVSDTADKYPQHRTAVDALPGALENGLDPGLKRQVIERLNADSKGTVAEARQRIDQDPTVLARLQKNPNLLGDIMGIKVVAPAAAAVARNDVKEPAAAPPPKPEPAPAKATEEPEIKPLRPQEIEVEPLPAEPAREQSRGLPAMAAGAVAAAAGIGTAHAADKPQAMVKANDEDAKAEAESQKILGELARLPGFEEFLDRVESNPNLQGALGSVLGAGGAAGNPKKTLATLQQFQQKAKEDPKIFEKMNEGIKNTPPGLLNSLAGMAADNPMRGVQMLTMSGSLFGGINKMVDTIGQIFPGAKNFLGGIMTTLSGVIEKFAPKIMQALDKFSTAPVLAMAGDKGPVQNLQNGLAAAGLKPADKDMMVGGTEESYKLRAKDPAAAPAPATPAPAPVPAAAAPKAPNLLEPQEPKPVNNG